MGGGKSFKAPVVSAPTPPPPVMAKNTVSEVSASQGATRPSGSGSGSSSDETKSQIAAHVVASGGRASTIITGALGDTSHAPVAGKTLLGQ